jgi:hypothetical protein
MQLVRHLSLAPARGCRARVVELVALAKSADAADGYHALVPGREAAIRCAAAKSGAVDGTPGIGIVGKGAGRRFASPAVDNASAASTIVRIRIASLLSSLSPTNRHMQC